jgi:SAM-dependent methyltransferase
MEDPREGDRLAAKVNASDWVDRYLHQSFLDVKHGIPAAGTVLEVGCGPAVLLAEINRRRPDLHCVGIDAGVDRLVALNDLPGVRLAAAKAQQLPLREESCDLVYSRMLLEYLPNPEQAVREMVRATRPGGSVLLQDLDGQLIQHWPPDPTLDAQLAAVVSALRRTGFDPQVGRRLYGMATAAGLEDVTVAVEGYHVIAGRIDPNLRRQWQIKFDIVRPAVARLVGPREADAVIEQFMDYLDRPETLTFSTQFTVTGRRPD